MKCSLVKLLRLSPPFPLKIGRVDVHAENHDEKKHKLSTGSRAGMGMFTELQLFQNP